MVLLKKITFPLLSVMGMLFQGVGHADPVNISVTGKVVAGSCTVGVALTSGQLVNLGSLGRTQLLSAGSASEWKSFTLNLSNCPSEITKSSVTFTGTPDNNDMTLFANGAPSPTAATGVAVQMASDNDHNVILSNNSTLTANVDGSQNITFPLAARLYTPTGGVRPGDITSTVLVNFTYQ
jgi:minor fimbrial subunit